MAGAGVLERVGQAFLDDPVGRQVDRRRERERLAIDVQLDGQAGPADLVQQGAEGVEAGLGHQVDAVLVAVHGGQQAAHLGQRGAPGLLDAGERIAVLGERVGELVPDRTDLEHHHADGVGDDVVELTRDPRPFLGHRDSRGRVPLPLGLGRAHLRHLNLLGPFPHGETREPADPEQERDEDELADRVRGLVGDHDRGTADRDGQARLCPQGGGLVPEQERGGHPDGEDAAQERD